MGDASPVSAERPADKRVFELLDRAGDGRATGDERLAALRTLLAERPGERRGGDAVPRPTGEVNNHVHTIYSFSPYTPAMAAYRARAAGLAAAGSVDHDSAGAAVEMLEAAAILGIGCTVGLELRVSFLDSPFAGRKINNPDSPGIAYMTIQGLPRTGIPKAAEFIKPIAAARGARNRRTTAAASVLLEGAGYGVLDYDRDVLPLSKAAEGGSVTERHILAATAASIIARHGKGPALVAGIAKELGIAAPLRAARWLSDSGNPHYLYDLLGLLKAGLLDRVFIQPGPDECIPAADALAFAHRVGAIPAYAYLGDVADSPTGDKKAESFEDSYLDELVPYIADLGFQAMAYMPPRNTRSQIDRLRALCARCGLMEISGVDINSSRQSFNCPEVLAPAMSRLLDATWALVAHEKLSGIDGSLGLFSADNFLAPRSLAERIDLYARVGRALDPEHPEDPELLGRLARGWR
ncbi:MAG: PHP domain-containing protein [Spirochaetes bacterium]|nr:PHP domain-containing protein [Spirochaetota bacterium]